MAPPAVPAVDIGSTVRCVHELSICTSLASIVEEHAAGRRVEQVLLDIGHLRQVVPDTLRYSWEIVVSGTALDGSVLEVNHIPAVIACRTCATATTIDVPVFRCPCGSTDVDVTSGRELLVRSLVLADPVPATSGGDPSDTTTQTTTHTTTPDAEGN
jgi:hydrogenase nickel incorporation protein HypA/HybF